MSPVHWIRWSLAAIGVLLGGYMAADGGRALVVGDYWTPANGEHAGRLGPWAKVVAAVGIAPRSTVMKAGFVVLGGAWLAAVIAWLAGGSLAWWLLLVLSIASLWYLPLGTLLAALELALLILWTRASP